MRLWIAVREGDWTATDHGSFGNRIGWQLTKMPQFTDSGGADRMAAWHKLDELTLAHAVPVETTPETLIGELTEQARAAAQHSGHARGQAGVGFFQKLHEIWLASSVTDQRFDPSSTVADAELADGDLAVLCIEWFTGIGYMMGPAANPERMFATLELAATTDRVTSAPRLWGALLYTDEDVELATYVRTHFDELNALSGPLLSIFVVERPASWTTARRYWRQHLEPPLLRSFAAMRWLLWVPFDRHRCYDIARQLGVPAATLPCLVVFRGSDPSGQLVFPIESVTSTYLRGLFGEIVDAVGQGTRNYDLAQAYEDSRDYAWPGRGKTIPPLDDVLTALASAEIEDRAAFDRVVAAQERIRERLRPAEPAEPSGPVRYEFRGYTVFTHRGGSALTENFNFYGQTTFINRPIDTVIQDFQNNYAEGVQRDLLVELLRLVLSSTQLPDADKERAAREVHEITGELVATKPDVAKTKLTALRNVVSKAADIAKPALTIIAKLVELISG